MTSPGGTLPAEWRPWRMLDAAAAFGGGIVAVAIVHAIVGADTGVTVVFGILVPAQSLGMLAVLLLIAPRRQPWRQALRWSMRWSDSVGVIVGLGLQVALSIVSAVFVEHVLRRDPPTQELIDVAAGASGVLDWGLIALGVVVLGPLAEETVFRGVVLRALERRGRRTAVYGSAAMFALIHLLDPNTLVAVPLFFVLGIVLGNEVLRTGRLGRAVAIHAGFNLMTVIALYALSVS